MTATTTTGLPALEDNRQLRFLAFATLYAAQGMPWGIFVFGIPAWLAARGASAAEIGSFVAITALPWSFKLVAGPVMDRFTYLSMGRRRPWVIGAQLGILLGMCLLAFAPQPDENLMLVAAIGFLINSFCALQDVAVDGMAIDILPVDERARANAYMYGGQIVGISGSSAAGTWLISNLGLGAAAIIIGFAVLLIMLVPVFVRERNGEKLMPWSQGEASPAALALKSDDIKAIFGDLAKALVLPMSLLLVLCEFLNRAAAGLFLAVAPVVTVQQLGWADTDYANWQAGSGIAAAVFGILVAPWIDRRGATIALFAAMAFRFGLFVAIGATPGLWETDGLFATALVLNYLSGQAVTVGMIALFMTVCARKVAATQFAVYMASANLALSAGSALVASLGGLLDIAQLFYVGAGLNLLFLLLWPLFNIESHLARLQTVEANYKD